MAAEQRRRSRINERFERLRQIVPHCERANMASFLDVVIDYIQDLQGQVKGLQGQRGEGHESGQEAKGVERAQAQRASGKVSETSTEGTKRSGGGFWDAEGFKEEGTGGETRVDQNVENHNTERPVQFYSGDATAQVYRASEDRELAIGHKRDADGVSPTPANREESPDTPPLSPTPFAEVLADTHFEAGDALRLGNSPKRARREN